MLARNLLQLGVRSAPGSFLRKEPILSTVLSPWTVSVVLIIFGCKPTATPQNSPQPSEVKSKLDRILSDWQRRSSLWRNLDVRFVGINRNPVWDEEEHYSGRLVLMPKGLAVLELGKPISLRIMWKNQEMHQIFSERKEHFIWPIAEKDRGRLPAALALHFFWQINTEGLKDRFRIALVKEDAETWHMEFIPLATSGNSSFSKAYLQLDRATYLPQRYVFVSTDGKSSKDFRVMDARFEEPARDDLFQIPQGEDWTVTRLNSPPWFLQLSRPDLLP